MRELNNAPIPLEEAYSHVITDSLFAFVYKDGECFPVHKNGSPFQTGFLHLVSGSFNPIHDAHKNIFNGIDATEKMFEIAIERIDKEFLSLEALRPRLEQMHGVGPILVNRWPYFIQKTGILRNWTVTFYIGIDTAVRLLEAHGLAGIQGINAKFIVHDRIMSGEHLGLHNHKSFEGRIPMNCHRGETPDPELMSLSSTMIRKNLGIKDLSDLAFEDD